MSDEVKDSIDSLLQDVHPTRRQFLKRSLLAGGAAVLALPSSSILAQDQPEPGVGAEGKGKGNAKGAGKGGRGKGKGGQGKGKGGVERVKAKGRAKDQIALVNC